MTQRKVLRKMKSTISCLSGVMGMALIAKANVYDDAKFVLDVRGDLDGNSNVTAEEIGNAVTYRASDVFVSYFSPIFSPNAREYPSIMQTLETEVSNPYWCDDTSAKNYLYLPQTSWTDETTGKTKCDSAVLKFAGGASLSNTVTVYSRFRWDGAIAAFSSGTGYQIIARNAEYWTSSAVYGWTMGIRSDRNAATPATTGWIAAYVNGSQSTAQLAISSGKWYDAFVVIKKIDDTSTLVTVNLIETRENSVPQVWSVSSTIQKPLVFNAEKTDLYIGSYSASSAGPSEVTSANGETSGRLFRGGIARLTIWERELTQIEMRAVASDFHGAMWSIGMTNGSSSEFGSDDYSEVTSRKAVLVKDVFRPGEDPVRLMRGKLTAAHPALILRGDLPAAEAGLAKVLVINPLFAGQGATFPVRVSLNGQEVGSIDLRKDRALLIKKRYWKSDENGEVELRIERMASAQGEVEIDSLSVGGSFQVGTADEATGEMGDENTAPPQFFAGDSNAKHMRRAVVAAPNSSDTNLFLYVDVPARLAGSCDFVYTAKLMVDGKHPEWGTDYDFALQLNGRTIWQNPGVTSKDVVSVSIPSGSFRSGLNELCWVAQSPAGSSWWWINFDYHRLEVVRDHRTAKGLLVNFQ